MRNIFKQDLQFNSEVNIMSEKKKNAETKLKKACGNFGINV